MDLTLFVPLYNEEKRPKVGEYISSISQIQGLTLVLVNDGSSDDTLSMLELSKGPNIKIVDLNDFPEYTYGDVVCLKKKW